MGSLLVPPLALAVTAAVPGPAAAAGPRSAGSVTWVGAGTFHKVYDTSDENPSRYINDHAVIKGPDGTWHMFGITGGEAPPGTAPDSSKEDTFAHATAPSLKGPWTTQPPVLTVDPDYGEDHLWAPYVLENDGTYYMFYSGGRRQTPTGRAVPHTPHRARRRRDGHLAGLRSEVGRPMANVTRAISPRTSTVVRRTNASALPRNPAQQHPRAETPPVRPTPCLGC